MRTRPDVITTLDLPSGPVRVDEHGYLTDPDTWTPEFAPYTAQAEHLDLTPAPHEVFSFMRAYLDEHEDAAEARFVMGFQQARDGLSKTQTRGCLGFSRKAMSVRPARSPG